MFIRVFPADTHGSSFYRLEEPARVARAEGLDVDVFVGDFMVHSSHDVGRVVCTVRPQRKGDAEGYRLNEVQQDVAVFTRPAKASLLEAIACMRRRGAAIVVDIDDDPSVIPPTHPHYHEFQPATSPALNWQHLESACAKADLVTCTTQALADRYAPHGRYQVLPNCIPASILELERFSDGRTLGWAGDVSMHVGDMRAPGAGVREALDRADGWRFAVVGAARDIHEQLGLREEPDDTGFVPVDRYHRGLGLLDVGIVPLADTPFNRAKSYLKGIEYAARGVPFVASPTPEYERLFSEGIGRLAKWRSRDWKRELTALMIDESLRIESAMVAREVVAREHTYEVNAARWCEAWEQARVNRAEHAEAL
jgi:hypothetical protein